MDKAKIEIIYWKGEKLWLCKLLEHPKIMTQGETFEELEENIKGCLFNDTDGGCA